ncbi:MAG: TIGR03936 family radical SAM-associated protein [Clostridia bacterium]|nr:TIGR03936 family radical SAM-associated protein [Clostridia bacterium]
MSEEKINGLPIRIKFSKKGNLMYISHLDLSKTMQRIMVRANVDIWYSEGFNPQPRVVFAVPLPVGVESDCEFLDIKINSPMEIDEIKQRISKNFPDEMKVIDVYVPEVKFKHISFIDYTIKFSSPKINENTVESIKNLFEKECNVTKITKSGNEKIVNLCEFINSFKVESIENEIVINTILCADSEKYLNPELLIEAIKKNLNILTSDFTDEYYSILRNKMLNNDLTEFK